MNKEELISQLAQRMNVDVKNAQLFFETFSAMIQEIVSKGETVFIPELGTFEPKINQQ